MKAPWQPRSPTHEAALGYARRGWHVFPIEPPIPGDDKSGKRPFGALVPRGKDDATTDERVIDTWWNRHPELGVGISLAPSGLCVLDVDVGLKKDGTRKQGAASLRELEQGGGLDETMTAVTGGGGLHAYYSSSPEVVASKIGFRDGLDLIVSGYVVAPPSAHFTGGAYRWSHDRAPAKLPLRLVELARERKSPANLSPASTTEAIPEGNRNNALFRLGCALRDTGVGEAALKSALHFENQRRFTPPLADEELLRIADSVLRRVAPTRDVALGAVIEAIAVDATAPATRSRWLRDVGDEDPPPTRFYQTGFAQLDALMGGGICTRQVCGVIGPPSAGKSAFVDSIVAHVQTTVPVLHVSTELPHDELFVRYAALRGGFPWRDGLKGQVPRAKMKALVEDLRIRIVGSDDLDREQPLEMIFAEAAALGMQTGQAPVIVIDYVQLLARGAEDKIRQRVGEMTMKIRQGAQALDSAVIAVFSTKRDFYSNGVLEKLRESDDPTAYLGAAKESGDIEFDCATILFLDVDKLHEGLPKPARVVVARCRVGDIGVAGARAQLDVGKWWGDQSATAEVTSNARDAKKLESRAERECERVLDLIAKMPNRPWNELRRLTGWGGKRADAARDRLIVEGKIAIEQEVQYDQLLRPKKREVLKVVGNTSPVPGVNGDKP